MTNEIKETELNEVAGGQARNGRYYNYVSDGWVPYQIRDVDCLSVLAMTHGTTVARIMDINPLIDNPNVIITGFWLLLPPTK